MSIVVSSGAPILKNFPTHSTGTMSLTSLYLLFPLILTIGFGSSSEENDALPLNYLQVRPGSSSFKIALFADLHFGESAWSDWGPLQDVNSIKVMSVVLDQETPGDTTKLIWSLWIFGLRTLSILTWTADFVVYLGDVITANNIAIGNASLYWEEAISPTRARGIPWASVFGNHDDAPFEWPLEWFSATGIPHTRCTLPNSSVSGGYQL